MKKVFSCVWILLLLVACVGCSWLGRRKNPPEANTQLFYSGKILNKERLSQGGNLLLQPFQAGPKVEANSQLDKISFRIMKGVSDSLKGNRPYFNILLDDERTVQEADLVLQGYITEMHKTSALSGFLGKNKNNLGIEGKLVDTNTGEVLAVFSNTFEAQDKEEDHKKLGFRAGEDIGQFIVSQMGKINGEGEKQ